MYAGQNVSLPGSRLSTACFNIGYVGCLDVPFKGGVTPLFSGAGTMVFIPIKSSGAGASGAMVLALA